MKLRTIDFRIALNLNTTMVLECNKKPLLGNSSRGIIVYEKVEINSLAPVDLPYNVQLFSSEI